MIALRHLCTFHTTANNRRNMLELAFVYRGFELIHPRAMTASSLAQTQVACPLHCRYSVEQYGVQRVY
jgi:hypothetical protein